MEFIESSIFTNVVYDYLSDTEYKDLQVYLVKNPERGDVIKKSGGLRKVRWLGKGRGKRGGSRIIYYYQKNEHTIWMLTIYSKNECSQIPDKILSRIKEELLKNG